MASDATSMQPDRPCGAAWIGYAAVAAGFAAASLWLGRQPSPELASLAHVNLWFEADIARVHENMVARLSDQYRSSVHPLFPLLVASPTIGLVGLGVPPGTAVAAISALGAALVGMLFFHIARAASGRSVDAAVFAGLLLASSAFVFWAGVAETYVWGAATLLAPLALLARAPTPGSAATTAVSALSLSITATNWMAGLAATIACFPRRTAVQISLNAFAIVAAATIVQSQFYPTSGKLLYLRGESQYAARTTEQLASAAAAVLLKGVVLPAFEARPSADNPASIKLSAQRLGLEAADRAATTAAAAWLVLLVFAIAALRYRMPSVGVARLRYTTAAVALGQLGLHVVYGPETFLYALHYAPPLILLVAFLGRTRLRPVALALTVAVTIWGGASNLQQLAAASALSRAAASSAADASR